MKEKHTIKIIGGDYRTRLLEVVDRDGLRPTSSRMRETLFNWLQPFLYGAKCLDLFAGSGALGLEAISRGASSVTFIEKDRAAFQVLQNNIQSICKDSEKYQLVNSDALGFLAKNTHEFSLVFIDPPFGIDHLLADAVCLIGENNIYESVRYLVVEKAIKQSIGSIEGFHIHREMKTKESHLLLLMRD